MLHGTSLCRGTVHDDDDDDDGGGGGGNDDDDDDDDDNNNNNNLQFYWNVFIVLNLAEDERT